MARKGALSGVLSRSWGAELPGLSTEQEKGVPPLPELVLPCGAPASLWDSEPLVADVHFPLPVADEHR